MAAEAALEALALKSNQTARRMHLHRKLCLCVFGFGNFLG
jgi:hypothetical protein